MYNYSSGEGCLPVGAPCREFGSCQTECKHNGSGNQTVPIAPPSWALADKWLSHSVQNVFFLSDCTPTCLAVVDLQLQYMMSKVIYSGKIKLVFLWVNVLFFFLFFFSMDHHSLLVLQYYSTTQLRSYSKWLLFFSVHSKTPMMCEWAVCLCLANRGHSSQIIISLNLCSFAMRNPIALFQIKNLYS